MKPKQITNTKVIQINSEMSQVERESPAEMGSPEQKSMFEGPENERFMMLESNLSQVLKELREAFKKRSNGWAALALIYGSDKVTEKLNSSSGTISLVSGLFLSATIPLVLNPAGPISDLDNSDYRKYYYLIFMSISILFHISSIFNSCLMVFFVVFFLLKTCDI